MKKIAVILLFSFLVAGNVYAGENKIAAAVMDLEAKEGVSKGVVSTLSDFLRVQLVNTQMFTIVTRENMEQILKEQKLQMSGCTSQECIVQVGQLLGVRKMFTGSIGKVGATYIITLKIVDIESGKIEKAETEQCPKCEEDALVASIENIVYKITGIKKTAESAVASSPQYGNVTVESILDKIRGRLNSYRVTVTCNIFYPSGKLKPSYLFYRYVYKSPDKLRMENSSNPGEVTIYNGKKIYTKAPDGKITEKDIDPRYSPYPKDMYSNSNYFVSIDASGSIPEQGLYLLKLIPKDAGSYLPRTELTVDYGKGRFIKMQCYGSDSSFQIITEYENQLINGIWVEKKTVTSTTFTKTEEYNSNMETLYKDWELNPEISDEEFSFKNEVKE